jgi:hypothetical protein
MPEFVPRLRRNGSKVCRAAWVPGVAGGLRDHGRRGGTQNTFLRGCGRMATTVERRRSGLSNKPALGGRSGYEAGDARIPITARGHPRLTTPGRIHSRRRRKGQPTSSLQNGGGFFAQLARRARARRLNCPSPQSRAAAGCAPPAPAATSRDGRTRLMARPPSRTDLDRPDVRWNPMPHAAASLRHADAFLRHHAGLGVRGTSRFPSLGQGLLSYHSGAPMAIALCAPTHRYFCLTAAGPRRDGWRGSVTRGDSNGLPAD